MAETPLVSSEPQLPRQPGGSEDDVVISCENIHKTYLLGVEGVAALRGISVDVYRGEFLVIYGTSGGGKSTLLNVLGTIDTPTKGNLAVMNSRITDLTEDALMARLRCKRVGFVFQSFNLLGTMTAEENVSLPMIIAGDLTGSQITERAQQLLREVGLGHRINSLASQLSGGEQQRVTIARAMANRPEVLLMDEPTGDLDTKNTELIMNILLSMNRQQGLTMVMVTHDVYMKQYADRVLYLRDGRVHRIERVPREVNEAAYQALAAAVKDRYDNPNRGAEAQTLKRTVRRKTDYATSEAAKVIDGSSLNRKLLKKLFAGGEHPTSCTAAAEGDGSGYPGMLYVPPQLSESGSSVGTTAHAQPQPKGSVRATTISRQSTTAAGGAPGGASNPLNDALPISMDPNEDEML